MYVDLMAQENYININKKLMTIVGRDTAIYWTELMNVIKKVIKKKKFDEQGFFTVDRSFIYEQTTLTLEEQLSCDAVLRRVGALEQAPDNTDLIRVNIETVVALITSEDTKALNEVVKKAKVKKTDSSEAKKQCVKAALKNGIVEPDVDILNAMRDWVESILSKNFLTKKVIEVFQNTVRSYSSDKAVQLKIIELATIHAYKDASWAINLYQKDRKPATRLAEQKIASTVRSDVGF